MSYTLTPSIAGAVGAAALAVSLSAPASAGRASPSLEQRTRTVYVSVTDKSGAALTDLQAIDFEIKEGGKPRDIVSVAAAAIPLRVALLVADQGTGAFQLGLARFMQKLLGHAEFALYSVIL